MIMKSTKRTGPGSKTRTVMKKNEARKAPPPQNGYAFTRTMKPMKRKGPGSKTRTLMKKNEARKALPFFFFKCMIFCLVPSSSVFIIAR